MAAKNEIVEPTQGMHGTLTIGSDRYPYEVYSIINKRTILVAKLIVQRNPDGSVSYVSHGPHGGPRLERFTRRGPNLWAGRGIPTRNTSRLLTLGTADWYQDPSY